MRVWVSGSEGRLGREVVAQLQAAGQAYATADRHGNPPVDLEDPRAVAESLAGCDAIIHCAGIPSPEDVEPADLVRLNTMTTFNALEEAWRAGIRTAVLASSGSIWGTAWGPADLRQPHVPVDAQSPLQYVDPYALTKDFLERMGQMYARRGMTVTALRFHWILPVEEVRALDQAPADGLPNLWGYVALPDAARACLLALDRTRGAAYESCIIAAGDTVQEAPTERLVADHTPVTRMTRPLPGTSGCFDLGPARDLLGWEPRTRWR